MFTSKQQLTSNLGVIPEIAAFFVDRAIPQNNTYWKGRYLYVGRGTGFLFIPIFFDLKYRAGVPLESLLNEDYIQLMESLLNIAAMYEEEELDFITHIQDIEQLVLNQCIHTKLFNDLKVYFRQQPQRSVGSLGTENGPLNRGDAFLYLLTVLHESEETIQKIINYWYLLVPSFLLMDDIMDIQEDQKKNEENGLLFYGFNANGVRHALNVLDENFKKLEEINPLLGSFFRSTLKENMDSPYFKSILNINHAS